jgi:hypothetical protein
MLFMQGKVGFKGVRKSLISFNELIRSKSGHLMNSSETQSEFSENFIRSKRSGGAE